MSYCTQAEVRSMLKTETLNQLLEDSREDDPDELEARIGPVIDQAIADADSEIDGYLSKRYPVPICPTPGIIRKFSKDIALYNIFSRTGIDEESRDKTFLNRYNAAVKFLTLVSEGKVSIGADTGSAAGAAASSFSIHSNGRIFDRDQMQGM